MRRERERERERVLVLKIAKFNGMHGLCKIFWRNAFAASSSNFPLFKKKKVSLKKKKRNIFRKVTAL